MNPHQRYEQLWRELQLCDELGFDYGFCVEHHFRPDESRASSPSLYVVGAAARTRRIRVGPMGYVVPLYHPLRLAEEIALVDQIVGGAWSSGLFRGSTQIISSPSASTTICANRRRSNSLNICVRPMAKSSRSLFAAMCIIPTARSQSFMSMTLKRRRST